MSDRPGPETIIREQEKRYQALTDRLLDLDDEKPDPHADGPTLALHIRKIKGLLLDLGRERYGR